MSYTVNELSGELHMLHRISIKDAVYSNDYTAGIGRNRRSAVTPVRVPHFVVAKRIMLEK